MKRERVLTKRVFTIFCCSIINRYPSLCGSFENYFVTRCVNDVMQDDASRFSDMFLNDSHFIYHLYIKNLDFFTLNFHKHHVKENSSLRWKRSSRCSASQSFQVKELCNFSFIQLLFLFLYLSI